MDQNGQSIESGIAKCLNPVSGKAVSERLSNLANLEAVYL